MQQNPVTLTEKLRVHFREVFNVLDIVGIATYLASFTLKVSEQAARSKFTWLIMNSLYLLKE